MTDATIRAVFVPVDLDKEVSVKNLHTDMVLEEARLLIGCEIVELYDLGICSYLVDEVGALLEDKKLNARATFVTCLADRGQYIYGDVLVVGPVREEWRGAGDITVELFEGLIGFEVEL